MAQQDLAGMLTGITQAPIDPMVTSGNQAQRVARAQQYGTQMRQGIGSLFGADTRTTKEKADQMMANLDVTKKADRDQMLKIVGNVNPQAVPALRAKFVQMDKEQQQKDILIENKRLQTGVVKDFALQNLTPEQYEKLAPALDRGVVPLETIKSFVNKTVAVKRKPQNFTYTDANGRKVVEAVWLDEAGKTFNEQGVPVVLPSDAQITTTGKTAEDVTDLNISPFSTTQISKTQDKLARAQKEFKSLSTLVDDDFTNFLSYKGKLKAKAGEVLSRMTGLGGEALNEQIENLGADDLIKFSGEKSLMFAKLEDFFNTRRKEITGAAAAVAELKMLRKSILNGDVSPEEGRVKVQEYIDRANEYIGQLSQQLQQGGVDVRTGVSAEKLEKANNVRNLLETYTNNEGEDA
jgi:hypothetical protein